MGGGGGGRCGRSEGRRLKDRWRRRGWRGLGIDTRIHMEGFILKIDEIIKESIHKSLTRFDANIII